MKTNPDAMLWRYMDLAKFVSLLASRGLYFHRAKDFEDPYEGYMPRSHIQAHSEILQRVIDGYQPLKDQLVAKGIPIAALDQITDSVKKQFVGVFSSVISKFGVSCWHENTGESDAMWKLYSALGQGIAIETTANQLSSALAGRSDVIIDNVRYMDFDSDPIEKGYKHYSLFLKRKSYEHEREIRATILLSSPGNGQLVPCDLEQLVNRVHLSSMASPGLAGGRLRRFAWAG